MNFKISVIIPVNNAEDFLSRSIISVLSQKYEELECLLVESGSEDRSWDICLEYSKNYPDKVKAYQQNGGSLGEAKNRGLKEASGDYVLFLSPYDALELESLSFLVHSLKSLHHREACPLIYGGVGIYLNEKFHHLQSLTEGFYYDALSKLTLPRDFSWGCLYLRSYLIKNEFLFEENPFYENFSERFFHSLKAPYILVLNSKIPLFKHYQSLQKEKDSAFIKNVSPSSKKEMLFKTLQKNWNLCLQLMDKNQEIAENFKRIFKDEGDRHTLFLKNSLSLEDQKEFMNPIEDFLEKTSSYSNESSNV